MSEKRKESKNGAAQADGPLASESAATPPAAPQLTPEVRAKLGEIRSRIEVSVGQLVLLMMQLPRYRSQTLSDLNHLIIEPLLRDRVSIAFAKGGGDGAPQSAAPVGAAIWASVSDEVDARISEQVKAGTFPVRLGPDDWASGETLWLLDIVAMARGAASAVLANFHTIAGKRQVKVHPMVRASVEPKLLEQLRKPPEQPAVEAADAGR